MTPVTILTGRALWSIWSEALKLSAPEGASQNFDELEASVQSAWEATATILGKAQIERKFISNANRADPFFHRRIGRFLVAEELLSAADESMLAFFGNFAVLDCFRAFGRAGQGTAIEYTAVSPLFDVLPQNTRPPMYNIIVSLTRGDDDGRIFSFSARRSSPKDNLS